MKLLPIPPLPNLAPNTAAPFLWGQDLLWRNPYASSASMSDLKTQLPAQLPTDPRLWGREDVGVFLRWCEREFDLPKFEMDLFQMNGKALCLLTKTDLAKRIPGAGDILHNILDMLVRDAQLLHRHLPNSPITPTSRYLPSSPAHNSHPPTPNWTQLAPPDSPFHTAHLQHFIANSNSVTLSPAPSVDSQVGSPPQTGLAGSGSESGSSSVSSSVHQQQQMHSQALQQQQQHAAFFGNMLLSSEMRQAASAASSSSTSNQSKSDSEDDAAAARRSPTHESLQQQANAAVAAAAAASLLANVQHHHHQQQQQQQQQQQEREQREREPKQTSSPTSSSSEGGGGVTLKKGPKFLQNLSNIATTWPQQNGILSPLPQKYSSDDHKSQSAPNTPFALSNGIKNEFFPNDSGEPNTNGRLLWDFLQQLLNDPAQRYSSFIAWKCRDTGVFKIVDPAGLAQLWGIQKNHLSMNYDKMSRALRYYYRVNILRKVQGERHCYQFLRNPTELKNIKNISMLRQQPPPAALTAANNNTTVKAESSSPTYSNGNSMIPPPSPSAFSTSFHHLTLTQAAAVAAVAANHFKFSPPPPTSPVIKAMPHGSPASPPSVADSSVDMEDMPTDLSTGGAERRVAFNVDCYPLIRNSNGLTTIQLVKAEQERERERHQFQAAMPMEDVEDGDVDTTNCSNSSSSGSNGRGVEEEEEANEPEIDVTNVSNSNCDPTDLTRKYD